MRWACDMSPPMELTTIANFLALEGTCRSRWPTWYVLILFKQIHFFVYLTLDCQVRDHLPVEQGDFGLKGAQGLECGHGI